MKNNIKKPKLIFVPYNVLIIKIAFLLIGILLNLSNIIAQESGNKISGIVKDASTLSALENVNIVIVENSRGNMTNQLGEFSISGIPEGSFTIKASMTGYNTERKRITVKSDKSIEVDFYLNPQTYQINSVNIVAPKEYRSLLKEPYTEPFSILPTIRTITNDEIQKQVAHNVIDAINYVPSGFIETRGRQVKNFFSVRGQKYPYPDYAINGIWQQEFEELPYFFSTSDIESIEIIRSSAALLTGLSGIAGLINIKTREYSQSETNLELEYGSFNSIHTHFSNGNKIGRFGYAMGIGYDKTDGPDGKHAKEEMLNFYF